MQSSPFLGSFLSFLRFKGFLADRSFASLGKGTLLLFGSAFFGSFAGLLFGSIDTLGRGLLFGLRVLSLWGAWIRFVLENLVETVLENALHASEGLVWAVVVLEVSLEEASADGVV